jgi:FkbM family methyltransferase
MKDYSQSNEQAIILKYFGVGQIELRGGYVATRPGTVLDIGANDGITLSNSRALVELGWNAVLVEPAEVAFRKLVANNAVVTPTTLGMVECKLRSGITLVNAAITTQDGPITFYDSGTHLNKGDTSLLSTTRPEELARWKKSGEVFTKTVVRGITIATLLKETGLTRAEMISIDCEGVDLDVLRQLDLTALGTRMVCVEVNRNDEAPFREYFAKHGFRVHHRNYENLIAVIA